MSLPMMLRTLAGVNAEIQRLGSASLPDYRALPVDGGQDGSSESRIAERRKQIDDLNQHLTELQDLLTSANERLDAANENMRELRAGAGVDAKESAVGQLNAQIREAQDRLQYLKDTRAGEKEINAQAAAVAELRGQLEEAERLARIARFEFEHSDAFRKQQEEIANARAQVEATKEQVAADRGRIEEAKKALEAEEKRLASLREQVAVETKKASLLLVGGVSQMKVATADAVKSITKSNDDFAKVIEELAGLSAFGGHLSMSSVLQQLAAAVEALQRFQSDPNFAGQAFNVRFNPHELERQIQTLVQIIKTWGGRGGMDQFTLEEFMKWLRQRKKTETRAQQSQTSLSSLSSTGLL